MNQQLTIKLGQYNINSKMIKQEAGTGYFKKRIEGDKVKPEMGNINVTVSPSTAHLNHKPISSRFLGFCLLAIF